MYLDFSQYNDLDNQC